MSTRLSKSLGVGNTNKKIRETSISSGIVVDVILDESHPRLKTYSQSFQELFTGGVAAGFQVGGVVVRTLDDRTTPIEKLPIYMPTGTGTDIDIPLIGEEVYLIKMGGKSFYQRMPSKLLNKGDARPQAIPSLYPEKEEPNKSKSYSNVSQTGTSTSNSNSSQDFKFGEYFQSQLINKLKLYEGDRLIQSRFGQSLRFSGYNNESKEFSPTIILRNKQAEPITDILEGDVIEEDIINDGSTIVLSSNEYELPFVPGDRDTELESAGSPIYYESPNNLKGNQILLNSDRIILSSKKSEMIFFSKGNISFLSDGKLTIDNSNGGAEMDFNGEVRMTTNSNDVFLIGDGGEIYLNTESNAQPLVRGNVLLEILQDLIDAINQQVFLTPSGPTSPGPTNSSDFNTIKSRLEDFLSTVNYTE